MSTRAESIERVNRIAILTDNKVLTEVIEVIIELRGELESRCGNKKPEILKEIENVRF